MQKARCQADGSEHSGLYRGHPVILILWFPSKQSKSERCGAEFPLFSSKKCFIFVRQNTFSRFHSFSVFFFLFLCFWYAPCEVSIPKVSSLSPAVPNARHFPITAQTLPFLNCIPYHQRSLWVWARRQVPVNTSTELIPGTCSKQRTSGSCSRDLNRKARMP